MNIGAGCHPNKVKVSGPGVAKSGLKAFEPTYFTVDCSEAGQGEDQESTEVEMLEDRCVCRTDVSHRSRRA